MYLTTIAGRYIRVVVFCLLAGAYVIWGASKELGDFGGDNAVYLLSADYLSPWAPHSAVAEEFFKASLYPPLFPLSLALVGGSTSLLAAHLITIVFLLIAFVVLFKWQRTLDIAPGPAFILVLIFALLPGTYLQALDILSENLYLMLSLLALWFVSRSENNAEPKWLRAAAVVVGAAMLTRSAGVALLAAFILYLLFNRRERIVPMVLALFPVLAWHLLKPNSGGGYFVSLNKIYGSGFIEALFTNIATQSQALWYGWVENFVATYSIPIVFVIGLFGVISLIGLGIRLSLRKLDAIYAALYLLLLFLWPFPDESRRFIFVLLPILMVQGLLFLDGLPRLQVRGKEIKAPLLMFAILTVIVLPQLILNFSRFIEPLPGTVAEFRRIPGWYWPDRRIALYNLYYMAGITNALKSARNLVPEGECIISIKSSITSFYTKRLSKGPPLPSTDEEGFFKTLTQSRCVYFFLVAGSSPSFKESFYPLRRLEDKLDILESTQIHTPTQARPLAILAKLKSAK